MNYYQCTLCYQVVSSENTPDTSACSALQKKHHWNLLAKMGEEYFECRRCLLQLNASEAPSDKNCKKEGKHFWVHSIFNKSIK